jgi:hypothetical protein
LATKGALVSVGVVADGFKRRAGSDVDAYASVGVVAAETESRAGSDGDDKGAETTGERHANASVGVVAGVMESREGSDGDDKGAETKGERYANASVGVVAGVMESHYYEPSISAVDTAPLAVPFECTTQACGCLVSATIATNDTCTDTDMMIDFTSAPSLAIKKYSFLRTVPVNHFSTSTSSGSHAASTASSLPRQFTVANLLDNAAEAIFQAYSAGAEPYELDGHPDVVELCHQLAKPHLDDVTRKRAFERVAVIAHERVHNTDYVQKAQRAIIQLFKRFRTDHKQSRV